MFDSHCHLTDGRFDDDRAAVVTRARQAGVTRIVTIASDLEDAHAAAQLAASHDGMWSTAGVHPHEVSQARDDDLEGIRELATGRPEVVAIGESGLDYFYDHSPRELQRRWFENQLGLACELDLPLVIHSREAEDDTIVVFDRIRENLNAKGGRREDPVVLVDRSINETLPRTVLTSGTTLAVLLALLFVGGAVIRDFTLVLILGVVIGTYSSIFVAAPALLEIQKRFGDGSARRDRKKSRATATV